MGRYGASILGRCSSSSQFFVSGVSCRILFRGVYDTYWLVHKGGIGYSVVFDGIGGFSDLKSMGLSIR